MNRRNLLLAGASAGSLVGCARQSPLAARPPVATSSAPSSPGSITQPSAPGLSEAPTTDSPATPSPAGVEACVAEMSLAEVVGQLFMAGLWEEQASASWRQTATDAKIGSIILMSTRSKANVETVTGSLVDLVDPPLLFAVDQEGGQVQRFSAAGFTKIPNAQTQGTMGAGELEKSWVGWGGEMAGVGVLMDLAPVADVVPADLVASNPPVGQLKRNYGTSVEAVSSSVTAVVRGLASAGVAASLKHFPGLGRVSTNTDFGDAEDTVTGVDDPLIASFAAGIKAGAASVMISSAVYTRIDPSQPASFSSAVIDQLLRQKMGFDGVVISDDIGAAKAMAKFSPATRAVRFLDAGGDIVLTVDHTLVPAMVAAVIDKASADPTFAGALRAKATRVLRLKASVGIECAS